MDDDTRLTISYRDLEDYSNEIQGRAFCVGLLFGLVLGFVAASITFATL